jgi:hypothetical protein
MPAKKKTGAKKAVVKKAAKKPVKKVAKKAVKKATKKPARCVAQCPHCAFGRCDGTHTKGYHHCGSCDKHWII